MSEALLEQVHPLDEELLDDEPEDGCPALTLLEGADGSAVEAKTRRIKVAGYIIQIIPNPHTTVEMPLFVSADLDQRPVNANDPMERYLAELAQARLLRADEEAHYAKQIEAGEEAEKLLLRADHLTEEARGYLEEIVAHGRDSKEVLVKHNMRLVVSIAKRFQGHGLSLADLIHEAVPGLIRAVEMFDYRLGFKFSTYSTWWIRQAIGRAIADKGKTIRIPVHMHEKVVRVKAVEKTLFEELYREPTPAEIAERTGFDVKTVEECLTFAQIPVSLNMPVGGEGDGELGDLIEDESALDPQAALISTTNAVSLHDIVSTLGSRDAQILTLRFGLNGDPPLTLEEMGKKFNLTREGIRQIEAKALSKLRHPSRAGQEVLGANSPVPSCLSADPDAFYPDKGGSTREPKRICANCPAQEICLEVALNNDERFGVWGDHSERERRQLKKGGAPKTRGVTQKREEFAILSEEEGIAELFKALTGSDGIDSELTLARMLDVIAKAESRYLRLPIKGRQTNRTLSIRERNIRMLKEFYALRGSRAKRCQHLAAKHKLTRQGAERAIITVFEEMEQTR